MPWVKGQSGNAKGAPKRANALARIVRSETQDGEELVRFKLTLMRDASAETQHRIEACNWLADRGWGKAVETIVLEDERESTAAPEAFPAPALEDGLGPTGVVQ